MRLVLLAFAALTAAFPLNLIASDRVEIPVPSRGAILSRSCNADGAELTLRWEPEGIDIFVADAGKVTAGLEPEDSLGLSFHALLPTWRGERLRVTGFRTVRGDSPLPGNAAAMLERRFAGKQVDVVREGKRVIFRDISGTIVEITPFEKEGDSWYPLSEVTVRAERVPVPGETRPRSIAPSFRQAYRMFFSDEELDELGQSVSSGGYLVVTHPAYLENLQPWIEWKRRCGFPVRILEIPNNPSFTIVRDMIASFWETAESKPEYLLLVGDPVAGNDYTLPGDYVESGHTGWVITDHPYSLLEGDDIWPEMWVGRFSVTTTQELLTVARKTVAYEAGGGLAEDAEWITRGLVVCDNTYSSTGLTSSWVRREMLEYGFSAVDSVWFPPTNAPGPVSSAINDGRGWVNYRGFGSPTTWQFPLFSTFNILDLNNENQTPVVTSIVCGGGQFDSNSDPCLGEAFLRAGTPNSPRGGVAFVGPSELNTHTRWNNCLDMGIYQGILHEGIEQLGPAVFRGKMAVWNGFPNNHDEGLEDESAWFYFFTYNILGDPGLLLRTRLPLGLSLTVADTLSSGTNDLPVLVGDDHGAPLEGITVSLAADDWGPYSRISDSDGRVRFDLTGDPPPRGDLQVTANAFNTIPALETVRVDPTAYAVAFDSLVLDSDPTPGAMVNMTCYLHNVGTAMLENISGAWAALEMGLDFTVTDFDLPGEYPPGESLAPLVNSFMVPINASDGSDPGVVLTLDSGGDSATVRVPLHFSAPRLETETAEIMGERPGGEWSAPLSFVNAGSVASIPAWVMIFSEDPDLSIVQGESALAEIEPGETAATQQPITLAAIPSAYPGVPLPLSWTVTYPSGRTESGELTYIPGTAEQSDPYGPDRYGYLAFDDTDTSYWNGPTWEWFEIDPSRGGVGTTLNLPDFADEEDASTVVVLPFPFTFYGETYNEITVCSNGWLNMGDTGEINFRNWNLPDGGGPENLVAPFWDDLVLGEGDVAWFYDEERGRVIVQWSRMRLLSDPDINHLNTFQAVLYDPAVRPTPTGDGEIEFYYLEIHDTDSGGNYSTIGIRNDDGTDGLQLRYASHSPVPVAELAAMRVYRLTTAHRPDGPAVRILGFEILDDGQYGGEGNGDGNINNGETIALAVSVKNFGPEDAPGVTLTLETEDPLLQLVEDEITVGSLAPGETADPDETFLFHVAFDTPDRHLLAVNFHLEDGNGNTWDDPVSLQVFAPWLTVGGLAVVDDPPGGNGNGFLEPGETAALELSVRNLGRYGAGPTTLTLFPDGLYTEIATDEAVFDTLPAGEAVTAEPAFVISLSEECPDYYPLALPLNFETGGEALPGDTLNLRVGFFPFYETFELDDPGNWVMLSGEWHVSDLQYFSPTHSLRWGDVDGSTYGINRSDRALSRIFTLMPYSWLDFRFTCDFGMGDGVTLRIREVGSQTVFLEVPINGLHAQWTYRNYQVGNGDETVEVAIELIGESNSWQEGTGFYIDDIAVYAGETAVGDKEDPRLPREFALASPGPNPFNSSAVIRFDVPARSRVRIGVYNVLGREVAVIADRTFAPGVYSRLFDGNSLSSGIYFLRLESGKVNIIRKAVLLR